MINKKAKNRAEAVIEYMALIMFFLTALWLFDTHIVSGFVGRWKTVGDSFDHGREFDPRTTKNSAFDSVYHNMWYDEKCFFSKGCDCLHTDYDPACQCFRPNNAVCRDCIVQCTQNCEN